MVITVEGMLQLRLRSIISLYVTILLEFNYSLTLFRGVITGIINKEGKSLIKQVISIVNRV